MSTAISDRFTTEELEKFVRLAPPGQCGVEFVVPVHSKPIFIPCASRSEALALLTGLHEAAALWGSEIECACDCEDDE